MIYKRSLRIFSSTNHSLKKFQSDGGVVTYADWTSWKDAVIYLNIGGRILILTSLVCPTVTRTGLGEDLVFGQTYFGQHYSPRQRDAYGGDLKL